jgi:hypothetical protein
MARLVAAVERVVALPAYREHVLAWAPSSARHRCAAPGVFLGYDFHLGASGPQLIEINTNAGGGLLNALLARAQKACCDDVEALLPGDLGSETPEHLFLDMFRAEWRAFAAYKSRRWWHGEWSLLRGRVSPSSTRRRRRNTSIPNSCCSSACSSAPASRP